MNYDTPPPSWYEPRDLIELEDDEPAPWPAEPLVISAGSGSWSGIDDTDD